MRVLAVNIRAGGSRASIRPLLARCERHEPCVVVLSEFRETATGALVRAEMRRLGFEHQSGALEFPGNGVLIAATLPFRAVANPFGLDADEYPNAVVQASFEDLRLYGVYLPGQDRKRPHLRCLIAAADGTVERGTRAICIGDLNSGRNERDIEVNVRAGRLVDEFSTAGLYAQLEERWIEAWDRKHPEEYEYSWYPFRNDPEFTSRSGWRVDKAFVSPALLPSVRAAEYDHRFRLDKLTDHSALIVTLDPADAFAPGPPAVERIG